MPTTTGNNPRSLIQLTGASYFPIALIGRLPFAMVVVGVLTLVVSVRGSLEHGGLTAAAVGAGTTVLGPVIGVLADRFGQRVIMLTAAAVNAAALLVLTWVTYGDAGLWALLAAGFFVGATAPQLSPFSRARLVAIIRKHYVEPGRGRVFNATMSYESTADELVFIFGPVAVGLFASAWGGWAPMAVAAVISVVFVGAFALHPTEKMVRDRHESVTVRAPLKSLLAPGILVAVFGIVAVGLVFGSSLVSVTAFMSERFEADLSGLVYSALGLGGAVSSLAVMFFPAAFSLRWRWFIFSGVLAASLGAMTQVSDLFVLILLLVTAGLGIGPVMVTIYSLGSLRQPEGRGNAVMTLLGSGVIVGQATASAVVGSVSEAHGYQGALVCAAIAGGLVLLFGALNALLPQTFQLQSSSGEVSEAETPQQ